MGTCERMLRLDASADSVWKWMEDAENLFAVNIFHEEVNFDEAELGKGSVVAIPHNFFGMFKQDRRAKVREFRKYYVAFGEHKAPEEPGRDAFPHNQSFQVVPVDDDSCIIVNHLKGEYIFPGAKYVGERLFDRYMPWILDEDNRAIGVGVGSIEPADLPKPKGIFLWPLIALGGRLMRKSARRKLIEDKAAQIRQTRAETANNAKVPVG